MKYYIHALSIVVCLQNPITFTNNASEERIRENLIVPIPEYNSGKELQNQ